jgi:hypothetical protein
LQISFQVRRSLQEQMVHHQGSLCDCSRFAEKRPPKLKTAFRLICSMVSLLIHLCIYEYPVALVLQSAWELGTGRLEKAGPAKINGLGCGAPQIYAYVYKCHEYYNNVAMGRCRFLPGSAWCFCAPSNCVCRIYCRERAPAPGVFQQWHASCGASVTKGDGSP